LPLISTNDMSIGNQGQDETTPEYSWARTERNMTKLGITAIGFDE